MNMENELSELDKLKSIIQGKKVFTDEMFAVFEKKFNEIVENFASEFVKGVEPDSTVFNQGFKEGDLKNIDIQLSEENIKRFKELIKKLTFVREAFSDSQIKTLGIDDIIEQGKFSNKMKNLHEKGIDGTGTSIKMKNLHEKGIDGTDTSIGIIDSCSEIDETEEFKDRDVESIVIYKDDDGVLTYGGNEKVDMDHFHGKTTASLAAGNECGVAPKSKLYLFKLADGVKREEARNFILNIIKNNDNINLDVLIDPSFNIKSQTFQEELDKLTGKKCEYFSTEDCWENCIWGRYNDDSTELLEDEIAKKLIEKAKKLIEKANETKTYENGMKNKLEVMKDNDKKVLIPCTGMTSVQEDFKNSNKYYGSVCGASFPTAFLGGLFALARQKNPNITKENFFEIMRNKAKMNSDRIKYLDTEALLKEVEKSNFINARFSCNEYYLMGKILTDSYKMQSILGNEENPNLNSMSTEEKDMLLKQFDEFMQIAESIHCIDNLVNFGDNFDRLEDSEKGKYNEAIFNKLEQMAKVSNDNQFVEIEGKEVLDAFDKLRNTDFYKSILKKTIKHKEVLQENFEKSKSIAEKALSPILTNLKGKSMEILVLPPEFFDVQFAIRRRGK